VEPRKLPSRERHLRDIDIINRNAEELSREALDVLGYQELPLDDGPSLAEQE
jgi:hypothetical protein